MHCSRQKNSRIVRDVAGAMIDGMNLPPHACLLAWHDGILPCLRLAQNSCHTSQHLPEYDMQAQDKAPDQSRVPCIMYHDVHQPVRSWEWQHSESWIAVSR